VQPRPFVATKGGFGRGEGRPEILSSQIEESLRRLRVGQIDLYYLHRVDPETPLEESVGAIAAYRERGAILNVGLSEVGVGEIERARAITPIAAVQNHYNLDERRWDDVVDYCERESILFVPFYPLHTGASPAKALAWLLRRSPVTLPIPGTLSLEHVKENVSALDYELSDEEFEALSKERR
jgi:pyridoxine 4-dehydrogenase